MGNILFHVEQWQAQPSLSLLFDVDLPPESLHLDESGMYACMLVNVKVMTIFFMESLNMNP